MFIIRLIIRWVSKQRDDRAKKGTYGHPLLYDLYIILY